MRFKMFHLKKKEQNLELVNLRCVIHAQPIPLSLKGDLKEN